MTVEKNGNLRKRYKKRRTTSYIKYWGVKWLIQSFCPAETSVTADKSVYRSPNISYMYRCGAFAKTEIRETK